MLVLLVGEIAVLSICYDCELKKAATERCWDDVVQRPLGSAWYGGLVKSFIVTVETINVCRILFAVTCI